MLEEDMEVAIKMVVVGNGAVGKSSMIQRYCKGIFTKDYKKTIGVDFLERQIQYVLALFSELFTFLL
uniref:RAB23, member RAS oncogene family n=2 Tax=Lemuriformes TaxID=376915 RepID=A0A2K6GYU6_PROCO